jgi:hypothetical protein
MRARSAPAAASFGTVALAVLAPKCPLCVAAALSALGLGTASAGCIAPFVRPAAFALAAAAVLALVWGEARRRRRAAKAPDCCAYLRRAG